MTDPKTLSSTEPQQPIVSAADSSAGASIVVEEQIVTELDAAIGGGQWKRYARFVMAALGSIPWVGGFLGASAALQAEKEQKDVNQLTVQWLKEHEEKIHKLKDTLLSIFVRLEQLGGTTEPRISTEEYLGLVRKGFRIWDQADTDEKRRYIALLLTNAAGTALCTDDLVRLFLDWIDQYHEAHFLVIREIHKNPGSTRADIWEHIRGNQPREDSAEADLFRLLIRDLSTGGVIRQARDTNEAGQFLRKSNRRPRSHAPSTMESAFEDTKPYFLTELGRQFVHYTMNEAVTRLEGEGASGGRGQDSKGEPF